MEKILVTTAISLSLITSTSILAKTQSAITCPAVSAIQSVQFDLARPVNGTWGAGISRNNFGTDLPWKLLIEGISAKTSDEAIKIASEAAKSLSFVTGPSHIRVECSNDGYCDVAMCEYTTARGYPGYTYAIISGPELPA